MKSAVFGTAMPWLIAACAVALTVEVRASQTLASATITGTVYDPSALVVPGAAVTLTSSSTNQVLKTTTDGRGQYRLVSVPVGDYDLSVEVNGFAAVHVTLSLTVGQAIDVPIRLVAAAAAEAVRVVAQAPIVDAARVQLADTITPREVDALPLNGRNHLDLAFLASNVSRTNTRSSERFAETSAVPGTGISQGSAIWAIRLLSTDCRPMTTRPIWPARPSARK